MKTRLLIFVCFVLAFCNSKAQVTQINSNQSLKVTYPLGNNKTIVVSDTDSSIWVSDGTLSGTIPISTNIKFEEAGGLLSNKLIFVGSTDTTGSEIFITDGTSAGTGLVKNIVAGATGSDPAEWALLNGFYYFTAETAAEGRELWRTDGTSAGTTLVKDIIAGPEGSNFTNNYNLFSNGSYLLFSANTPSSGVELYKSDGTAGGTVVLKDISPLGDSSNPREFFQLNNIVLFLADDSTHGEELWKTDGTAGGTVMVKDINPGAASSTANMFFFFGFHLFNNHVYFKATDGNSNGQLWSTDGTTGNTVMLKDIIPGNGTVSFILITDGVNLASKFIFPVSDIESRNELWESDGTVNGTKLFKAFALADSGEITYNLLSYSFNFSNGTLTQPLFQGNKFFFIANDSIHGRELWISDGVDSTVSHTSLVKDIKADTANGFGSDFTSYVYTSSGLFFSANDGTHGNELWKSDGTSAGTTMVADINPAAANSDPELPLFVTNGKIIFSATDGDDANNTDLYSIDGTFTALPVKLSEFTVTLKSNDALLQWSTLNEVNGKDFIIQRSYDAQHFDNIGTMPVSNTSSLKHTYSFVDEGVSNSNKNIIYYRILTLDKDGKSESTNVIFIKLKGSDIWAISLLTNPVQNFASVGLSGITKDLELAIKDINGKVLYKESRHGTNGQISISVSGLPRGMYLLVAQTNNERRVIKFIKQ